MARHLGSKASVLPAFTILSELMYGLLDAPHAVRGCWEMFLYHKATSSMEMLTLALLFHGRNWGY